ncbi:MAG: hypothetical protein ACI4M3_04950, partial [Acutalibacteraceae bacterium]
LSEQSKETAEAQIERLKDRIHELEMDYTDKNIALIEMTASRNALYRSLQETQMRLAEVKTQHSNDIESYEQELAQRLEEKRKLQEEYDAMVIKAKRYDELQDSVVHIKMQAEIKAHNVIDEAQEHSMDAVNLIDNIAREIDLFRQDIVRLRQDIKIGTLTLDDRLDSLYLRLCQNMDKLMKIKKNFYSEHALPYEPRPEDEKLLGTAPVINYPDEMPQNTETEKKE